MKFANSRYLWIPVRDYLVSSFFHIYIYIFVSYQKRRRNLGYLQELFSFYLIVII